MQITNARASAVLAGDEHPHEPRFGRCLDRLLRETVVPVDLGGKGLNHPSSKLPNGGAKPRVLGRKFEIQLRRYLE